MIIAVTAAAVAVLFILYVFAIRGRKGNPALERLRGFDYAHRGLHGNGVPENSMAAFKAALEKGFGAELDIHLTADGELAVIHDSSLLRTAGADLKAEQLTKAQLKEYRLEGSDERIPLLEDVLELYHGKFPLIIELKPENNNHAALCDAAFKRLDRYGGDYSVQSFDPRCLMWIKKHRPHAVRGQLAENFFVSRQKMSFVLKFILSYLILNFLTLPDYVAYNFQHKNKCLSERLCRKLWGLTSFAWTIRSIEDHASARSEGRISIFEKFVP